MSLILGIYSKKGKINEKMVGGVLKDFSLNGKRKLRTKFSDNFILSALSCDSNYWDIVENEDCSLVFIFGGQLNKFNGKIADLVKKKGASEDRHDLMKYFLPLYLEFKQEFLKCVNGIFIFAVYDRLNNELIFGNDYFGFHPLFIYDNGDYIIFSSEYQPLTKLIGFNNELNYDAIAEYFTLGFSLGNKTIFKCINNLSPGSIFKVSGNQIDLITYCYMGVKIDKNHDLDFFAQKVSKCINDIIEVRVGTNQKIFCDLTGGVDTRLILTNLTDKQRRLAYFNTQKSPNLREDEDTDVIIAKLIAEKLKINHNVINLVYEKDVEVSFFQKNRVITSNGNKKISGKFGGEFLGGACFELFSKRFSRLNKKDINNKLKKIFNKKFSEVVSDPYLSLKDEFNKIKSENKEFLFFIKHVTRSFFTNVYGGSRSGRWFSPHLFFLDSMCNYVFLDQEFLKLLLTIPQKYLIDYKLYNQIYKDYCFELIDIPTNSPLAEKGNKCIEFIQQGVEPKKARKRDYSFALKKHLNTLIHLDNHFYNLNYFTSKLGLFRFSYIDFTNLHDTSKNLLKKEYIKNQSIIKSFIDFEDWHEQFFK